MKQNNWTIIAGLFGLSAILLSGCGWFDGGPSPNQQGGRPGADRTAPVLKALPPPQSGRPHESGVAPADETRTGPAVGSSVSGTGGQKAQKEEAEKQAAEQAKKDRERAQRCGRGSQGEAAGRIAHCMRPLHRPLLSPSGEPSSVAPPPAEQAPPPIQGLTGRSGGWRLSRQNGIVGESVVKHRSGSTS